MKLRKLTLTAGALALSLGGAATAQAVDLVVVSWGGAYTASQQNAYHDPYMAMHGDVKIINDDSAGTSLAKLRAQNEAGNVSWALVDVVASTGISLCDEGLVEEIDHDKVLAAAPDGTPASEDFGDLIVSPCFIPQIVYSTAFGYRHDLLKHKPRKIKDVFNLHRFPGKRSLEKVALNNLEWALIADGVKPSEVYNVLDTPAGVRRAFAMLDTIKDHVVWWDAGKASVAIQLLADGEVVIASAYNGRLFSAIEEDKQPIGMLWDWQVFDIDGWVVPKGGPHQEEVLKYLRFATDTQRLADQAKYISYGPARKSSAPLVGKHATLGIDMAPHMPTDPKNAKNTLLFNYEWWADNRDDMDERFEAWLAR
ncbi:MAG: extracellular solute-binding protein [Gammaproteobacteria bacterium]|nr:extracellular solute-binding protein [Gammaproteobacteria bacterium]MDD9800183.1 extracellular solute-binding protein [Gammaproteobacteria bacterium]MDD9816052.1 extracellular solute-binding protein [Gammaproteobacteria bacterium]MDD9852116.1 extracellular solute-binding protein [Gammaproteobacteria bacterium]MDD9870543.1 extracellular solute-binding protein [Gammaproteobacteria bacterium]